MIKKIMLVLALASPIAYAGTITITGSGGGTGDATLAGDQEFTGHNTFSSTMTISQIGDTVPSDGDIPVFRSATGHYENTPAITDAAQLGQTQTFTSSNTFSDKLMIPSGTSPTMDTVGGIAVDTSSGQLAYYNGSAAVVVPSQLSKSFNLETPVVGDYPLGFRAGYDITIEKIVCVSSGATSTTISLFDADGSDGTSYNTLHAGAVCGTTEFSLAISSNVAAGRRVRPRITAVSGTPGWVAVDVYYREKKQ